MSQLAAKQRKQPSRCGCPPAQLWQRKHKQTSENSTPPLTSDLQAPSSDLQGKPSNTRPQRKLSKTLMDTLLRRLPVYMVEVPALQASTSKTRPQRKLSKTLMVEVPALQANASKTRPQRIHPSGNISRHQNILPIQTSKLKAQTSKGRHPTPDLKESPPRPSWTHY